MTPTTPEQARKIAAYPITDWASAKALNHLADQVDALTKERDALLIAAKYAEHIDATPENQVQTMLYDTLVERDTLAVAAKLALDALDHHPFNYKMNPAECAVHQQAIDAIKSAGVQ